MKTYCLPISPTQVFAGRQTNLSAGEPASRVRIPPGDKKHLSICVFTFGEHLYSGMVSQLHALFPNIIIIITGPWLAFDEDLRMTINLFWEF